MFGRGFNRFVSVISDVSGESNVTVNHCEEDEGVFEDPGETGSM